MKPKELILIIEDDLKNMKLLSDLLTLKGYEVLKAFDGRSGTEMAQRHRPGLILMDIQMPVMDGFDVTRILKSDPLTRPIVLWALTAHAMPGDENLIRARGCDGYFTKPLDLHDLLARIERVFDGSRPSSTKDQPRKEEKRP